MRRARAVRYRGAMSTELVREVAPVSLATQGHYLIKRKFWSLLERVFRVFTGDGQLIMYIKHPLLKLREEFMVYADEAQTRPLLRVKSQQMIAINFSYEIHDAATGELLGSVQKKGLRSIIRDKFIILDPQRRRDRLRGGAGGVAAAPVLPVPDVEARDLPRWPAGRVHQADLPVLHQGVHGRSHAVQARAAVRARGRAARADGRSAARRSRLAQLTAARRSSRRADTPGLP